MNSFRICITGGSGFIGTTAMQWTIDRSFEVINFDIRPPKILSQQPFWKYVDIRDKEQFTSALEAYRPSHILHLAATTGMDIDDMSFFNGLSRNYGGFHYSHFQQHPCGSVAIFSTIRFSILFQNSIRAAPPRLSVILETF